MYKTLHKKQGSVTVQLRFARSSVTFCAKRDKYEVRLDFSDTQSQKAVSEITVLYKGEKVYSRTIRLSSVYGYLEDGEDEKGENENKDGSLSW